MKIVIIGGGPAGITVAETLCRYNFKAEIDVFSAEPYPPYSPPALSEYLLTGRDYHLWRGSEYPGKLGIVYRPGTVVAAVMPNKKAVQLADGTQISYDHLVLASGSRLFAPVEGENQKGFYNLKSLSSVEEMLHHIRTGDAKTAIVIGAGFIGAEIGLTLAEMGLQVTQLVRSRILRTILDDELSLLIERIMEDHGIKILRGADHDAIGFVGEPRVYGVKTQRGDIIKADLIVAATGMRPNIEYLQGSGIAIDTGVIVDERMRTNLPDISAAGDVVTVPDLVTGKHYVHGNFSNALAQAQIVACDIMGWDVSYAGAENMNSLKHLGIPMIVAGNMDGEEIRVQNKDAIRKLYLHNNHIIGFRLVGDIRCAGIFRSLMNRKYDVTPFRDNLLDRSFGIGYLEEIAASPALWQT